MRRPLRDTTIRLSRVASGIMAVVWIGSGAWKATHPAIFAEVVRGHGVVPGVASELQVVAPLIEIAGGIALIACTGSRPKASLVASFISMTFLIVLTIYTLRIPVSALAEYGCGCHGSRSIGFSPKSHAGAMALNGALLVLQSLGLAGPIVEIAVPSKPDGEELQFSSALPICHSSSSMGA